MPGLRICTVWPALLALVLAACTGEVSGRDDRGGSGRASFATALSYSASVTVASHADVVAATPAGTDAIDAPPVSFVVNGQRRWLLATVKWSKDPSSKDDFHVYHTLLEGSLDRPFGTVRATRRQWELFTNWTDFPGRWWIVNAYSDGGGGVLAFVHVEFADGLTSGGKALRFGRARLGLAWSDDGGERFRYLGTIVVPEHDPEDFNVEAAPYLIKDGQLMVYFRDFAGIAVARAPLGAVLAAARGGGALPPFNKWHGGGWTSPGIGGAATALGLSGITHSDAAYSTATGRYYLATTTQRNGAGPSQISLYESPDGTQWSLLQVLHALSDVSLGWQYLSIVDRSGADNGVVGSRFYVYCGMEPLDATRSELRRIEVTLGSNAGAVAPASPTKPPCVGIFKVGAGLNYSNGAVYCYYDTWEHFMCMTGMTSAESVQSCPETLSQLPGGGPCQVPAHCQ